VRKLISKTTKGAPRKRSRVAAPSLLYEDWLIGQLKDPAEAAAYLETVIEKETRRRSCSRYGKLPRRKAA